MLIYVSQITTRVQYTFDFVLRETLHIDYELTANRDFFNSADTQIKWAYSNSLSDIPHLPTANLLFENTIEEQAIERIEIEDIIALFPVNKENGRSFDIFSSIFFLISRYEEYLPSVKDTHGRYAAYQSVVFRFGFLETAMVNRYILWFLRWLKNHFPNIDAKIQLPKALVTIDIDHPFYSKDVGLQVWFKRSLKQLSFFNDKDKYDTYDFILDSLQEIPSIFFILCPKHPSQLDHHNHRDSSNFQEMIQYIRSRSKIGIHPSYYAEEKNLIGEEIAWLSHLHQRPIKSNRFHYLKLDIEASYQKLISLGIQNDFSMACGSHSGFRSSTSLPYYFFDLKKNKKTNLKIYTPCLMDSTFQYNYQDNYEERCERLLREVEQYGGLFIPIFHNDILSEPIWQERFKELITKIQNHNL